MFSTAIFLTLLSFATATTATLCNIDPPQQCSWYNSNNTDEQRITLLINNLTTIEKINLLNSKSPAIPRLHIPYYAWWSEAAHGVAWAGTATVFPCSMALGATFDPLLVEAAGLAISNEARAKHLHHLNKTTHASELFFGLDFFAPNINIVRDIRWGRAQETYSEDPLLVGTLGAAVIKGMQQYDTKRQRYKTIATAKHFASYNVESNFAVGGTNGQYRLMYDVNVSHADLMQTFFPAFEDAIVHGGAGSIMCSYNRLNSYPMCASPYLKSIVRDRFKFPSYIVSDSGAVGFMVTQHKWAINNTIAAAAALNAGVDLNLGPDVYAKSLPQALSLGLVTMDTIDTSLQRVLLARLQMGMLDDTKIRNQNPWNQIPMSVVDSKKHRALARTLATESVVLLKNNHNVLPLSEISSNDASPLRILVTGPNANRVETLLSNYPGCKTGPGSAVVATCTLITPLKGLQNAAKGRQITFIQGVNIDDNGKTANITEVVAAAKTHDFVIFVGGYITCQETGNQCIEGEARDRASNFDSNNTPYDFGTGLPNTQLDLLHALVDQTDTTIILVVMSGSGVSLPFAQSSSQIGAILQQFYPGEEGGSALADIVYGNIAPSGRLPVTVPYNESQLPSQYLDGSMSISPGRTYRYLKDDIAPPLYWFGQGLGYSSFTYDEVTLHPSYPIHSGNVSLKESITVSVAVTNNGEYKTSSSDHVVMVFAQVLPSNPSTQQLASLPTRQLVGFQRVTLPVNLVQVVSVKFSASRLRLVDDRGRYQILKGKYKLWIGDVNDKTGDNVVYLDVE